MDYKQIIPTTIVLLISSIIAYEYISNFLPFIFGILFGLLLTIADFLSGLKIWQDFIELLQEKIDEF